mmetsp:Transcript_18918/g.47538  ORF Transcript_18918/g.47538 Transcript_18918/m.47538 type:complete len:103 (-) Transcript_18918:805-1113(-)
MRSPGQCSQYANCPYADCWACFHGWYLNGARKLLFEVAAHEFAYNHTWYASQNSSAPFPDSPVEFLDRACKITHLKYWQTPEPAATIGGEIGEAVRGGDDVR